MKNISEESNFVWLLLIIVLIMYIVIWFKEIKYVIF